MAANPTVPHRSLIVLAKKDDVLEIKALAGPHGFATLNKKGNEFLPQQRQNLSWHVEKLQIPSPTPCSLRRNAADLANNFSRT